MQKTGNITVVLLALTLLGGCPLPEGDTAYMGTERHDHVPFDACWDSSKPCPLAVGASLPLLVYYGTDSISSAPAKQASSTPKGVVSFDAATGKVKGLSPGTATLSSTAPNGLDASHEITVVKPVSSRIVIAPVEPGLLSKGSGTWPGSGGVALLSGTAARLFAQHRGAAGQHLQGVGLESWTVKGDTTAKLLSAGKQAEMQDLSCGTKGAKLSVSTGTGATLDLEMVENADVSRIELVDLEGKDPVVKEGQTWKLKVLEPSTPNKRWAVAAYTKDGRYIAGGGSTFKIKLDKAPHTVHSDDGPLGIYAYQDTRKLDVNLMRVGTDKLTVTLGDRTVTFPIVAAK